MTQKKAKVTFEDLYQAQLDGNRALQDLAERFPKPQTDSQYVDQQLAAKTRQRVASLEENEAVDKADLAQNRASIVALESKFNDRDTWLESMSSSASAALDFANRMNYLGFFGRLGWLLFGFPKRGRK